MDDILYPLTTFKEQFSFVPEIKNKELLPHRKHIIICGMGGSAISISLIKLIFPSLSVALHNDYGLPHIEDPENTLLILNSYSGNTEEVLDTLTKALEAQMRVAILSKGGELTRIAELFSIAHIVLPNTSLEPRFSIGFQIIGLLSLMSEQQAIDILKQGIQQLTTEKAKESGIALATRLQGKFPVLYASRNTYPIAYLIKAAINEGSKVPCFVNIFPESNHNELQSFISNETKKNAELFSFIIMKSSLDHKRTQKRFSVMSDLYGQEGFSIETLTIDHTKISEIFELILVGYYTATLLAINNKVEPYSTPTIQEFKQRMSS